MLNQLEVTGVPPGEIVDQIKDYFATQGDPLPARRPHFANLAGSAALPFQADGGRLFRLTSGALGRFAGLSQHFSREAQGLAASGPLALGLRHLLKAESLAARGKIVALGGDGALAASLAAGAWRDEATGEDSLF